MLKHISNTLAVLRWSIVSHRRLMVFPDLRKELNGCYNIKCKRIQIKLNRDAKSEMVSQTKVAAQRQPKQLENSFVHSSYNLYHHHCHNCQFPCGWSGTTILRRTHAFEIFLVNIILHNTHTLTPTLHVHEIYSRTNRLVCYYANCIQLI